MPPLEKGKSRESGGKQPRYGKASLSDTSGGTLSRCAPTTACVTRLHLNLATTLAEDKAVSIFVHLQMRLCYYLTRCYGLVFLDYVRAQFHFQMAEGRVPERNHRGRLGSARERIAKVHAEMHHAKA